MLRRRAFTLLEAVLALAILSGAVMATLGIRARAMIATEQMEALQRDERDAQAVFDLLVAGMLGAPDSVDRETGRAAWSGTLSGSSGRRYSVVREAELVPNPLRSGAEPGEAGQVAVWRYTVEVGGTEVRFLWHR